MKYSFSITHGDKSLAELLVPLIKDFAKEKCGLNIDIRVNPKYVDHGGCENEE